MIINDPFVHPTSVVNELADIGQYTQIWHFCHVDAGALIGENCNLGQNCYVSSDAIVGNGCRLGNNVSIYGNIELGDFVFCGPSMVFTHIDFPRATVKRHHVFAKTTVQRGVTLGANSTITPGVTIGEGSLIGAGAVVTKNIKSWALMVGAPAKQVGWVSALGEKINLPLEGTGEWICKHTFDRYILSGDELSREVDGDDCLLYIEGKPFQRRIID